MTRSQLWQKRHTLNLHFNQLLLPQSRNLHRIFCRHSHETFTESSVAIVTETFRESSVATVTETFTESSVATVTKPSRNLLSPQSRNLHRIFCRHSHETFTESSVATVTKPSRNLLPAECRTHASTETASQNSSSKRLHRYKVMTQI